MSRIFISHSSKDKFEAVAIRDWLATQGWKEVFLDLDPERGIAAGERWERALHEAANRCEAVVFLISASWLASGWCLKEYSLARGLNKKLFAGIIDPSKAASDLPPELSGTWQAVRLVGGQEPVIFRVGLPGSHEEKHVAFSAEGLRRLKKGLEKAGLDQKFFAWPPENEKDRAPYRGLKPLEAEDAGVFFGRDAPIVEATDKLRGLRASIGPRILVILGASGAGKSSFLRAGLLPRLARNDAQFLPLPPIRPERAALYGDNGLLGALERIFPSKMRADLRAAIGAGAAGVRPLFEELVGAAFQRTLADAENAEPPALIVAVDQAEELFRADGAEEGAELLALLRDLVSQDSPSVIALLAIRSDSFDDLEHAKPFEGFPQNTLALLPMPRGAHKEVIEGPANRVAEAGGKLAIEPQLTEKLLGDIEKGGSKDALPLLAFTLEQLFREYGRAAGALRLADYEKFGGIEGAIEKAVERAFIAADADPRIPRQREARLALLRRGLIPWLAGIDPDSKSPRRNIARRSDIPDEARPLIDLLVEERLLSADVQKIVTKSGETATQTTIEPAHEALLRQWGLLNGWLTEDFGLLVALEGVARAARDWNANACAPAWLAHQGQRLFDVQALDQRPDIAAKLNTMDRQYLNDCRAREERTRAEAEQRRLEREEEQARRLADAEKLAAANGRVARRTMIGLGAALILLGVAAWQSWVATRQKHFAEQQSAIASEQKSLAENQTRLAQEARNVAEANEERAKIKEREAQLAQSRFLAGFADRLVNDDDASAGLLIALEALPDAHGHFDRPTASEAEVALFRARQRLRESTLFNGHTAIVAGAAIAPDGRRAATATQSVVIWDVETGKEISRLVGHAASVPSIEFSADGRRLLTASTDGTARIWDIAAGKPIVILSGHTAPLRSAAFSRDGQRVVTASDDKTAPIWNADAGKIISVLSGHADGVTGAAFSPDGQRIVTASSDSTALIWDVEAGKPIVTLAGHTRGLWSAAFSPDGRRIVTAGDNTARIWDSAGNLLRVLEGHKLFVTSAAFSSDGRRVVTTSGDKTARIWDADTGQNITILHGHQNAIWTAAFSRDGTHVITASFDMTARIWNTETRPRAVDGEHYLLYQRQVFPTNFSLDGRRGVVISNGSLKVVDGQTGKELAILDAPHSLGAAISPDGRRYVVAYDDHVARIWDAESNRVTVVLRGHTDKVWNAAFSPDGRRLVTTSSDKTARVWDADTGDVLAVLKGHTNELYFAAFSPDGQRVVTTSADYTARIWDASTGKTINVLRGHNDLLSLAAFSPDGRRVVTASDDKTARIWDSETGTLTAVIDGFSAGVIGAAFTSDGKHVITALKTSQTPLQVWLAPSTTQALGDESKRAIPHCLTRDEREGFSLEPEPPAWCIEMGKWPYNSQDWRAWLNYKRADINPPFPDTPEWRPWLAARQDVKETSQTPRNSLVRPGR